MKKLLCFLALCVFVMNAAAIKPKKKIKFNTGTYGVCCTAINKENTSIELTLNDDHSFRYVDNTKGEKKINVNGTWEQQGNTVILRNISEKVNMSTKWKIDGSFKCLKSRKGLCWTRICHLGDCK